MSCGCKAQKDGSKCNRSATHSPEISPPPLCGFMKDIENAKHQANPHACEEDRCGILPRRIPLLGMDDPQSEKAKRAFDVMSRQEIWDIGNPDTSTKHEGHKVSRFRSRYERGVYPFQMDHSGEVSGFKITWNMDIEQVDICDLLSDTIEAQCDNSHWAGVAHLVFMDLLKHVPPVKLAAALPQFSTEFRRLMKMSNRIIYLSLDNEDICRRLLKALKELALVATSIGPELAFYAHDLFVQCNKWVMHYSEVGDRIVYEQKKKTHLNDLTDELHAIFEVVSGPEQAYAVSNMKLAIPTYKVPENTHIHQQAQRSQKK